MLIFLSLSFPLSFPLSLLSPRNIGVKMKEMM